MKVYIVLETVSYDYDEGREYHNIYGVYSNPRCAEKAKAKCESQRHGHYFADIEVHEVSSEE